MELSPPAAERALVLVVDDDARTARRLAHMLREDGYAVEVAVDGASALGRLSRDPVPAVLVTDLRMPHADGVAVSKYARSRRPGIPVVVVTGYPLQAEWLERAFEPPPVVFTKPLSYDQLSGELRRLTTPSALNPNKPPSNT